MKLGDKVQHYTGKWTGILTERLTFGARPKVLVIQDGNGHRQRVRLSELRPLKTEN